MRIAGCANALFEPNMTSPHAQNTKAKMAQRARAGDTRSPIMKHMILHLEKWCGMVANLNRISEEIL